MPLAVRTEVSPARRFAPWAIATWLLLLLAAMGCLQYLQHAEYGYLLAAVVVMVVCGGCILRQPWARPGMLVLALVLALWALVSGGLLLAQWGDFERARQYALAQPQLGEAALWLIARAQRTWLFGMALKAAAIPLLLGLAWQLDRPTVRAQFVRRRR